MRTSIEWTGTIPPSATQRWCTSWPSAQDVIWYLMPTTPRNAAPELEWDVAVERSNPSRTTYWITVRNLTPVEVSYEGRYAVLS
jgi:hypothetical protein